MPTIQPYRILHKPTGYFYQPVKGASNLSKTGKIYTTKVNGVFDKTTAASGKVILTIKEDSIIYRKLLELGYTDNNPAYNYTTKYFTIPIEEFEVVEFHC